MKNKIASRIRELKNYVDKQRTLIIGINNAIENDNFRPNLSQQKVIDHICEQGKTTLKEIKRLEKLMNNLS